MVNTLSVDSTGQWDKEGQNRLSFPSKIGYKRLTVAIGSGSPREKLNLIPFRAVVEAHTGENIYGTDGPADLAPFGEREE